MRTILIALLALTGWAVLAKEGDRVLARDTMFGYCDQPDGLRTLKSFDQGRCTPFCNNQAGNDCRRWVSCVASCRGKTLGPDTVTARCGAAANETYSRQVQTQCGQYCGNKHPNQCPTNSAYATCYAQCNSGNLPGTTNNRSAQNKNRNKGPGATKPTTRPSVDKQSPQARPGRPDKNARSKSSSRPSTQKNKQKPDGQ
jgi:hypothetical protein